MLNSVTQTAARQIISVSASKEAYLLGLFGK